METWAVIPMKPLIQAKTRLSNVLSEKERQNMVLSFFQHTVQQLKNCAFLNGILVISSDHSYEGYYSGENIVFLQEDKPNGLNSSINLGAAFLMNKGVEAMLVVHGDLPLLTSQALSEIFINMETPCVGIIPDRHKQGTNILLTAPPNIIDFHFGVDSFQKHQQAAQTLNIPMKMVFSDTLSFDIDTPEDLNLLNEITSLQREPFHETN